MASAGPVPPAALPLRPVELPRTPYPATDEAAFAARVDRSSARDAAMESRHPPSQSAAPTYPPWQRPTTYSPAANSSEVETASLSNPQDRPTLYNRPRRLSNSSTATSTSSSYASRESFESRTRSSPWSSQTSVDSLVSSGARASQANYPWQRPGMIAKPAPRPPAPPGELFAALPGEVLELILEELKRLHLRPGSRSCATCWMRDCCSIAVSSRKWLKFARTALYEDIQIIGADGARMKKRYKLNYGARLILLRRTLRSLPHIAAVVRSLKVPAVPADATAEQYHDLVASVVMACPNLERLVGFYPSYRHDFSRLFHALSTRPRLKEMNWVIGPLSAQRQATKKASDAEAERLREPDAIDRQQCATFFGHHVNWSHLTTLTVHCLPGSSLGPDGLLADTLRNLPMLRDLHLSCIPADSFNDDSLLSLPPLKKLSLASLPGVTTGGLSCLATRPSSASMSTLTLVHMDVDSLPALARILSNLTSLTTFNIVQQRVPVMPAGECIWLFPYLASASLRRLHWDVIGEQPGTSLTDAILARSIAAGGFPLLRALRTPHDPDGLFQSLCRPCERVDHPSDRYRGGKRIDRLGTKGNTAGPRLDGNARVDTPVSVGSSGGPPTWTPPASPGFPPSPSSPGFPAQNADGPGGEQAQRNSDLLKARLAAQARVEAARLIPRYVLEVTDEDGVLVERYGIGAFAGTVESRIAYVLDPDEGATDEGGGLVGIEELLGDGGERVGLLGSPGKGKKDRSSSKKGGGAGDSEVNKAREGCTGRWNTYADAIVDKKDRERWWHTERGRWRPATLA
ncbi:hypothetical protein VTK73DRAFT_2935 [Phialemonium thermophilum]|uniref:F-box domain-containing protein n=1 Tax=Phialemonium thermophilum TaxID=223376 RepID=A0ABR3X218_9PEZI